MNLKDRLRSALDQSARVSGMLAARERAMRRGVTILMYHRVLPDEQTLNYPLPSLVMPESAFRAQMAWLAEHARVLTLREACQHLAAEDAVARGGGQAQPRIVVTFDDGYVDNAEFAAPVLEALGLRATFFIATGFVLDRQPLWYDRVAAMWARANGEARAALTASLQLDPEHVSLHDTLESLKRRPHADRMAAVDELAAADPSADATAAMSLFQPMTPERVRSLHERGHEIGSHTVTHPILPGLDEPMIVRELEDSRAAIESMLGATIESFCYPNGNHDARVRSLVRAAGYQHATTTAPGLNDAVTDRFALKRIDITPQRVLNSRGEPDELAFRAEVSRLRELWR